MAIAIPAIVDAQLLALKNSIKPVYHSDTHTFSSAYPPYVLGNRAADLLTLLTNLIDAPGLHVTGIHVAADAVNAVSSPVATNQATADTMANEMKGDYNAHRIVTPAVHGAADGTNIVTAADGDGAEGKLVTLTNDIRTQLLAHMARVASSTHYVADPNVVTVAACTNTATAVVLINHLKAIYNAHIANINGVSRSALADIGAYTGVNYLIGAKVTFEGNITTALAGVTATVMANTTGVLTFRSNELSVPAVTGDHYTIEFAGVDADIAVLNQGKPMGSSGSNPYGSGPSLINAIMKLIEQLHGSMPAYLTARTSEPFHIGSPNAGAGSTGHGGAMQIADALQVVRDTVAAYTKPA
jgi:hypothetical protein